ncbi:MAG: hypothetical protein H0V17_09845 [Deltaproteobacteria bacterium]|nr:hypothetical protein [Deltaproteobacteria bacterium]
MILSGSFVNTHGSQPARSCLAVVINQLIALQLLHMNREETEVLRVLWAAYDDAALVAITKRAAATIAPARLAEWAELVRAATTSPGYQEIDRQLVGGARLG